MEREGKRRNKGGNVKKKRDGESGLGWEGVFGLVGWARICVEGRGVWLWRGTDFWKRRWRGFGYYLTVERVKRRGAAKDVDLVFRAKWVGRNELSLGGRGGEGS